MELSGIKQGENIVSVKGTGFEVTFDKSTGSIHSLKYNGEFIITERNGPELNALRAFVNNDNWFFSSWFDNGLHNLRHKAISHYIQAQENGSVILSFTVESQAPNGAFISGGMYSGKNRIEERPDRSFESDDFKFVTNQIWTVYQDGSIELEASITSNRPNLALPRLGYVMKIPPKFGDFTYYGRGPIDNYSDRKSSQFIEIHKNKVANEFINFPKPQNMGNHEDVRWCALTDSQHKGAVFIATGRLSVSALPYSSLDMILASHPYQLPAAGDTYLYLDCAVTGLGGNSCGPIPLAKDCVYAGHHNMGFIIRPSGTDLSAIAAVEPSGELPLSITRDRVGTVEITSGQKAATIQYTVNGGKTQEYKAPIPLRTGGIISAWYKHAPMIRSNATFIKLESIPMYVIYASSQESGEGNASHLVDGDPNTIWHTMYSVTVAKHPHWVDLDAGEIKEIKGFTYLPRHDVDNGNVKDYTVHVSLDGKHWGDPVQTGTFENNLNEKKVLFAEPVKVRYIRFTALSEQRGQDYASGAEITILEN